YHAQPFCLLNVNGFWDGLADFMDHVRDSGFLSQPRRLQLLKAETPAEALDLLDEAAKNAEQGVTW
ncbi:MAG: LOG family protein, partial [Sphingomicrobium sp.]